MTRGLIERETVKNTHQFKVSPALLQHLGVSHKHELPQFGDFMAAIDSFNATPETV
jgi:chromosome segregation and condensation protein ScpB